MVEWVQVPALTGSVVRLEPLDPRHASELAVAAEEDRSSFAWTEVPRGCEMEGAIARHLQRRDEGVSPLAIVRLKDGVAVGCTAVCNPRRWPAREALCAVEIGWTWLAPSAQRSGVNTDAKLLLLTYAFETLGVARVDLKTDARNERSRRAIAALGAAFEGVLRSWSPSHTPGEEGRLRDTAMFSVVAAEFARVKAHLAARLAAGGTQPTTGAAGQAATASQV